MINRTLAPVESKELLNNIQKAWVINLMFSYIPSQQYELCYDALCDAGCPSHNTNSYESKRFSGKMRELGLNVNDNFLPKFSGVSVIKVFNLLSTIAINQKVGSEYIKHLAL